MKSLYKYYYECGRQGELVGVFVATEEEIERLKGVTVDFGEVLGKHSDVSDEDVLSHISIVTSDQDFLNHAEELQISLDSGINPLDYLD